MGTCGWPTSYGSNIMKFSSSGTLLDTYGGWGEGNNEDEQPDGIAINQSTENVYVADNDLDRVQVLNEKGEYLKTIGSKGTGIGQMEEPTIVKVDASGNIWVADSGNQRVDEFKENGTFIKAFGWGVSNGEEKVEVCTTSCRTGLPGTGAGEFNDPERAGVFGWQPISWLS